MAQTPSPALLRLREADIVRVCGLAATGEGLRLADRHLLHAWRRRGGRLTATMDVDDAGSETWVEVTEAGAALSFAWACWCVTPAQDGHGTAEVSANLGRVPARVAPACAHVAAILTLWLRDPAIFAEEFDAATSADPLPMAPVNPKPRQGKAPVAAPRASARPARLDPHPLSITDAVAHLPIGQLRVIAEQVLGAAASLADDTLTVRLAAALGDPACVARLVAGLDGPARALLWAIRLRGGSVTGTELDGLAERQHGVPGTLPDAFKTRRHHLEARGLLFRTGGAGVAIEAAEQPGPHAASRASGWSVWYVPVEVARAIEMGATDGHAETAGWSVPMPSLPIVAPVGPPIFTATEPHPAGVARTWVRGASLRQLYLAAALLTYLTPNAPTSERDRSNRKTGGQPGARGAPGASLPALPGDPPAATFAGWDERTHLPAGMLRMVWRLRHAEGGAAAAAQSLDALTRLPSQEWAPALREVFRRWLASETFGDLADLTLTEDGVHARCDPHHEGLRRGALGAEIAAARRFIARVVGQLRAGDWYAVDDVLNLVWWAHPWFLRGRQRVFGSPAWWLAGAESDRPLRTWIREEWQRAEGQYIAHLLMGPLHWWGVVDLAGAGEGAPRAVRLTAVGAFLLGSTLDAPDLTRTLGAGWGPAALPTRDGRGWPGLAVQPCAAAPALLDALGVWARVTGPAGDRLLWYFSADLVCRAFDAGLDPETLLSRLRAADERDHTRVARDVAQLAAAWRARYGASRIATAMALLEALDAPTLREALALAPDIAGRCRQVSPTCALVPVEDAARLAQALDRRGFVV